MIQEQQTYFLELYRAGMRSASDIARDSLETTQRIQSLALQQMERNAQVWASLWRTTSESQAAMIGQIRDLGARTTDESARIVTSGQSAGAAANNERKSERKSA